jgi:hypothetical protein
MGSTEDADMLALIAAAPELATPDDTEIFLYAMPAGCAGGAEPLVRSCWSAADVLHKRTAIQAQSAAMFAMHHDWITC